LYICFSFSTAYQLALSAAALTPNALYMDNTGVGTGPMRGYTSSGGRSILHADSRENPNFISPPSQR